MNIKLVAITHAGTSQSRMQNLKVQQERVKPLNLELFLGCNLESRNFQEFYDLKSSEPTVKCLLYNTICVLHYFLQNAELDYLVITEDDIIFSENFSEKLQETINVWTSHDLDPSYILRIGFLPLVNTFGEWPTRDALYANTSFGSKVFFNLKQRALGAQAVVYSKEGARIFMKTFVDPFNELKSVHDLKYSNIVKHVGESKINPVYKVSSWSHFGPQYVPATDHLLNLESLNQAVLVDPIVIESEEGQTSSSCGSMKSVNIWAPLVQRGFVFK